MEDLDLPEYEKEYIRLWGGLYDGDFEANVLELRRYQQYVSQNHGSPELRRLLDKYGDT